MFEKCRQVWTNLGVKKSDTACQTSLDVRFGPEPELKIIHTES